MKFQVMCLKCYLSILVILLISCAPQPPIPSSGHLNTNNIDIPKDDIPPLVQQQPFVPVPQPTAPLEEFTVVVDAVAVDKLLFALARDASINVDVHPSIKGNITLNAINQTLPQLLERIAKQVDLRYQITDSLITVFPDLPYMHLYKVDYVNMSRDTKSEVKISTQIISNMSQTGGGEGGGSGGGQSDSEDNNSLTTITNESNNRFWDTLEKNINTILASYETEETDKKNVTVNSESGLITVYATHKQHKEIQNFLDQVIASTHRQVLVEATIAEVQLGNNYQAGVNWQRIAGDFVYNQSILGGDLGNAPFYSFEYKNSNSKFGDISSTVRLLETFGSVKVLSSPKIMALNNQTALLKVVDNIVYFTTGIEVSETETRTREIYTTSIHTVPVGLVMAITPQISAGNSIILNVRPTISGVIQYKLDPNPALALAGTKNEIPEIQTREIESILKIENGNIAIIGGLMQDKTEQDRRGIPLLSQLPWVGDLFSYRNDNYKKTELVIFIRPTIIKNPSLTGDLKEYKAFLPNNSQPDTLPATGLSH
ncbi:pilus (MSHA type) biogenesis protein MshL [Candidatus Halobeggiatoa sp. HSG11]|nr:pilus (MSHA type) biogenesis protein MshL [Candidatus Halobeggiatoa sp. HSG11]